MEHLIMRRKKGEAVPPDWGALVCRAFNGSDADINAWLDIVAEGLTGGRQDSAFSGSACSLTENSNTTSFSS